MTDNLFKFPRTYHLPWSPGYQSDDHVHVSVSQFDGREVVITQKMDGENSSLYCTTMHARSMDSLHHVSRDWLKTFWGSIRHQIPEGWRICGENLYAKHSIHYSNLPTYFMGFSVFDDKNTCLSWDDTLAVFEMLGIEPVPVVYRGVWDEKLVRGLWDKINGPEIEGFVVRVADAFPYSQYGNLVAKFVRKGHVQTNKHWKSQAIVPNILTKNS
jgi:hypothetical protein